MRSADLAWPRCAASLVAACLSASLAAQADPNAGRVGATAETIALRGLAGESVTVPAGGARITVVAFWATWNRFSAKELERLARLAPSWKESGVRIVAINVEGPRLDRAARREVEAWLAAHPVPFEVALDAGLRAFRAYGVVAVPTTFVLDGAGRILLRLPGFPVGGAERLVRSVESRVSGAEQAKERGPVAAQSLAHRKAVRHLRLARLLIDREQWKMARYTLERATVEDPELLAARIELARFFALRSKPERSAEILARAARRFPASSDLCLARARLALERGDPRGAGELARRALELNPALAPGHSFLGRLMLARKAPEAALAAFEAASKLNPLDPEPLVEAARICESLARKERALALYEKAYVLLSPRETVSVDPELGPKRRAR